MNIAVVEDERAIADTITYALETDGFNCSWFKLGLKALAEVEENNNFSLLVLDVGLPDINGFELCKKIRQFSAVPILFLTARADEVDKVVGLELGADDYMVKPFSPRELTARIRAILRRANGQPAAAVEEHTAAPFEIDENKSRILYFGKALDLSRYEYRMLKILIEKPGWVFSREQLMRQAWEEVDASFERTVDTHVKTLRAKMKKIKSDINPIVTRRGIGYSLREDW